MSVVHTLRSWFHRIGAGAVGGILLLIASITAMIWANSPASDSYAALWSTTFTIGVGEWALSKALILWINDGLMAIFFLLVGLEIKREVSSGALSSARKAALPVFAAAGGVIFPALIYVGFNLGGEGIDGWAIENRVYAEDPYRGFLPSIGRLVRYEQPEEGEQDGYVVRNDSGVREGDEISMFYDPMIAKLCAWGETREAAVAGMARALEDTHLSGLGHNVPFLAAVMDQERFKSGRLSTSYIKDEFPDGFHGLKPTQHQERILIAAAMAMHEILAEQEGDPSDRTDWIVMIDKTPHGVGLSYDADEAMILTLTGGGDVRLSEIDWRPGLAQFKAELDGGAFTAEVRRVADGFDIRHRAAKARVRVLRPQIAELYARLPEKAVADTSKLVLSPMPGLVVSMAWVSTRRPISRLARSSAVSTSCRTERASRSSFHTTRESPARM